MNTKIEVGKKSQSLIVLLHLPKFDPSMAKKFFDSKNDSKIQSAFDKLFDHFRSGSPILYRICLDLFRQSLTSLLQKDPTYLPGALPTIFRAFLEKEVRAFENFSLSLANERLFQDFMVYMINRNIDAVGSPFDWARHKDQNVIVKYKFELLPKIYAFLPKKNILFYYYTRGWEKRLSDLAKASVEAKFDCKQINEDKIQAGVKAFDYFAVLLQFYLPDVTGRKLLPQLIIFLCNFINVFNTSRRRGLVLEDLSTALNIFIAFKIQNRGRIPIRLYGGMVSHISAREYLKYYNNFIETILRVRSEFYSELDSEGKVLDEDLVDTLLEAASVKEAA